MECVLEGSSFVAEGLHLAKISRVLGYWQEIYADVIWYTALILMGWKYGHVFDVPGCLHLRAVLILLFVTHRLISSCGLMDTHYW